ncbi:MAG: GGDEF domain-containing protein, partial [Saccharofermentans sp.]|nr:GGDEF domain-containing protein [Saccharofermentans sp.]
YFSVYINDTAVYDFHPDLIRIYGNYYGECIHTVDLPALEENSEIRITYTTLYEASTSTFYSMKIQEGAEFVKVTVAENFANYMQCFVIMVLGVVLIVVGFLFTTDPNSIIETISLGTTAIVLALWTSSDSRIPQIVSENSAMVRVMDYMCLIFLPVPVIILIASVSKQLDSILPKILIGLCGLNLVLNVVWVLALGRDYSEVLIITHIILGIGVLFIVHLTIGAYKKSGKFGKNMKVIVAGFSVLIAAGILDIVRYYLFKAADASLFTRMGLSFFIILFTVYELNLFLNIIRKSAQTEIMERLAYNDGLTGLLNRLAFTQEENRIKEKTSGKYVLVQLDINFLKQVNDNYGHAEGDRFIIAAADSINDTFGRYGKCYRIGGDEFFAILDGKHSEEDYDKATELFEEKIKEVNDRNEFHIPLCIAYGKAVYVPGTRDFDEAEKEADKLMYENKKILKAAGYQAK